MLQRSFNSSFAGSNVFPIAENQTPSVPQDFGMRVVPEVVVLVSALLEFMLLFGAGYGADIGVARYNGVVWGGAPVEVLVLGCAFFAVCARFADIYAPHRVVAAASAAPRVLVAALLTFAALLAVGAALKATQLYSRLWFFSWATTGAVSIFLARLMVEAFARRILRNGGYVYKAISVGIGATPLDAADIVERTGGRDKVVSSLQLASPDVSKIADAVRSLNTDRVYLAVPWRELPQISRTIDALRHLATETYVVVEPGVVAPKMNVDVFGECLRLQLTSRPISGWNRLTKRAFDLVAASSALLLVAPLMVLIALAIKLESRGPVFFRQRRQGFNGSIFEIWKFRSMYVEKTDPDAAMQTSKDDPRVTRVGRVIRKLSWDELPQLINVIGGTMSVVGPRPHALQTSAEGKQLEDVLDTYASRHRVKPGITGWAQVNGYRGELVCASQLVARVEYDLAYIEHWSILFDCRVLLKTLTLMWRDKNAY